MHVQGGGGLLDPDPSVADALLAKVGRKGNNVVVKEWDKNRFWGRESALPMDTSKKQNFMLR